MKITRMKVGIVITLGAVFTYFNFYSEKDGIADAKLAVEISPENPAIVATRVATTTNITRTPDASNTQIKDVASEAYSFDSYIKSFGNCIKPVNRNMEGKSQQQVSAALAFQDKCEAWLLNSDPDKYADIKRELKSIGELASSPWDPSAVRSPSKDDEILEYFRSRLNSPVQAISRLALWQLLKRDLGFRRQLVATIGSSNHEKLRLRSAIDIATLRSCMNLGGCERDSFMMLSLCYSQELACGLNYYDWTASRMSANEFDDLMLLAAAVDVILEQGLEPLNP